MLNLRVSIAQMGSSGPLWSWLECHRGEPYCMKYILHSPAWLTLQDMSLGAAAVMPEPPLQASEVPCLVLLAFALTCT